MPVFEQGYQHWNGKLSSQLWRWWAITRHGVLMQFRSKLTRGLLVMCVGPAFGIAAFMILWSLFEQGNTYIKPLMGMILPKELLDVPHEYRLAVWTLAYHFFFYIQYFLLMLIVLMVGPQLISKDLRFNALPLYLSRPIRRWEYFLGKLGVIGFFVLLVTAGPAILAWVLGVLFSLKLSVVVEVLPLLYGSIITSLVIALSYGLIVLALSSLSRNSRYVSMMWFGFWMLSKALFAMLFISSGYQEWAHLGNFTKNVQRIQEAVMDTESAWQKIDQIYKLAQDAMKAKAGSMGGMFGGQNDRRRQGPMSPEFLEQSEGRVLVNVITNNGNKYIRSSDIRSLYPWWWSALTLLGLGVVSLCILRYRVKSLDRLR
jgi:ABC-2 type transport system permease protein